MMLSCQKSIQTQGRGVEVRRYLETDFEGIDSLWREAFPDDPPSNRAETTVAAKIAFQPDLLFVAMDHTEVVGSVMAGYDGHRGWLYAVAVTSKHRRTGLGTVLVRTAEEALRDLGCGKINLQVRSVNGAVIEFYERLGYTIEDRVSLGCRI